MDAWDQDYAARMQIATHGFGVRALIGTSIM